MVNLLRRCTKCGQYTLEKEKCPKCGAPVRIPHPPKLSVNDRFRPYRRRLREMVANEKDHD
ncbi:RNA-protein complex protein Nop10 [Candidatus Bathyarchaeota archaeon]|nr:RNA-protein complex protein Nop10 [Candidatus Bathyarchaeota archaeon]MBS7627689.1 RNA-protein complex protein Nop10 [Candidatus Bathyarchaeota archaeon]